MDVRLVKAPSAGTMAIVSGRSGARWSRDFRPAALGLVQGKLIDMVVASDIAEKSAGVTVTDVRGSCPQNMVMLAIAGGMAEVEECLRRIRGEAGL
ncbi:BMC domain-containing protein [Caniella muris]|uniref:BMC domain-containing protein n=1 Tax=Caniella muris TaxID=2941502 RepID=UPI00203CCAE5|nr:BMC domain-containing protein [Caniella muris]